jgi:hypothetical protein
MSFSQPAQQLDIARLLFIRHDDTIAWKNKMIPVKYIRNLYNTCDNISIK